MSAFCFLKRSKTVFATLLLCVLSSGVHAGGVGLGATRLIYPSNSGEVSLSISNTDTSNAFLIQSWIETPDGQLAKDFLITPPLFKIKRNSENTLRLVHAGPPLPDDRETLFLVNVKSIPSKDKNAKDNLKSSLQLAVVSRIKLFYRPEGLKEGAYEAAFKVHVERAGNTLKIRNPSPYIINLTKIAVGSHALNNVMIMPYAEHEEPVPVGAAGELTYSFINDYGAFVKIK